jgi:hypothetical protein
MPCVNNDGPWDDDCEIFGRSNTNGIVGNKIDDKYTNLTRSDASVVLEVPRFFLIKWRCLGGGIIDRNQPMPTSTTARETFCRSNAHGVSRKQSLQHQSSEKRCIDWLGGAKSGYDIDGNLTMPAYIDSDMTIDLVSRHDTNVSIFSITPRSSWSNYKLHSWIPVGFIKSNKTGQSTLLEPTLCINIIAWRYMKKYMQLQEPLDAWMHHMEDRESK